MRRMHSQLVKFAARQGQKTPAELQAAVETFAATVAALKVAHDVEVVHNADQTAVMHEYVPKRTLSDSGVKTVWIRCQGRSDRTTAMLLADSTGTKYPVFAVMKTPKVEDPLQLEVNVGLRHGFGLRLWKTVEPLQVTHGARIYGNTTAWSNSSISIEFLRFHFGARVDMTKKILQLWDSFSAHFTPGVEAYAASINVILVKVPPSCTSVCQPADVAWIKPLKAHLRRSWLAFVRERVETDLITGGRDPLRPSRADVVAWIDRAWSNVSSSCVINGFVKCQLIAPRETEPYVEVATLNDPLDDTLLDDIVRLHLATGELISDFDSVV